MESILDSLALVGLMPVVLFTVPLAIHGNGHRPLAMLTLGMCVLWGWASIDGLWTNQDVWQHTRRLLAIGALFWFPWRASR